MPIRPENKAKYPANWKEIVARINARARNRCEWCGVRNHAWGYRDGAGDFHEVRKGPLREAGCDRPPFRVGAWSDYPKQCEPGRILKIIEIVLTTAHVHDPDPANCADENLAALCQKCHLGHDRDHHNKMRAQNRVERELQNGQLLLASEGLAPIK